MSSAWLQGRALDQIPAVGPPTMQEQSFSPGVALRHWLRYLRAQTWFDVDETARIARRMDVGAIWEAVPAGRVRKVIGLAADLPDDAA